MARMMVIETGKSVPDIKTVLEEQGVGQNYVITDVIANIYDKAVELFLKSVRIQGIYEPVTIDTFRGIYEGEGDNDVVTPVAEVFPRAEQLTLFAVTLGKKVSETINALIQNGDYALGVMLDAASSRGAELAADELEKCYKAENPDDFPSLKVLRYSPGYCGWHVSGQKKLFAYLHPDRIGIALNDRCLMEPLKSISGVFIAAEKEKHYFDMTYACCNHCDSYACRERLAGLDDA
ncbi:MAG: vitamin B12 dependent-methionine synthase activation domain-containing protein [Candidatus Zixiibacteriota bacterium]